jgi:hypothetical protein
LRKYSKGRIWIIERKEKEIERNWKREKEESGWKDDKEREEDGMECERDWEWKDAENERMRWEMTQMR